MVPSLLLRKPGSLVGLVLDGLCRILLGPVLLIPEALKGLAVVIFKPSVTLRLQLSKLLNAHTLGVVVKDGATGLDALSRGKGLKVCRFAANLVARSPSAVENARLFRVL
jgi:hypothetical protein